MALHAPRNFSGVRFASGQTFQFAPTHSAAVAPVYIDSRRAIGALDRNLFGSFLEHSLVKSPAYEVSELGQVPYLDVAATLSPEDGKISVFILNRDLDKGHAVEINWQNMTPGKLLNSTVPTGKDLKAFNTFESPQRVAPQAFDKPAIKQDAPGSRFRPAPIPSFNGAPDSSSLGAA